MDVRRKFATVQDYAYRFPRCIIGVVTEMAGTNSQQGKRVMPDAVGASPLIAQAHAPVGMPPGTLPPGRVLGRLPQQAAPPPLPKFSLVIDEEIGDGWHIARLVQERPNFDYYVQSMTIRGPFRITRPWRGAAEFGGLMPDLSAVARTQAINWDWTTEPEGPLILPLFIKRVRMFGLRRSRPANLRLVVRDMTIKATVTKVRLVSNTIRWTRRVPWAA